MGSSRRAKARVAGSWGSSCLGSWRGAGGDRQAIPRCWVLLRKAGGWGVSTQMKTVKLPGLTLVQDLWSDRESWAEVCMKEKGFFQRVWKRGV